MITLTDTSLAASGTAVDATAYANFTTDLARELPASVTAGTIDDAPIRSTSFRMVGQSRQHVGDDRRQCS
jgi:hypothetical protein